MVVSYIGRGIANEMDGIPCQDALSSCRLENGGLVLALSDGAGSARFAAEAARTTADAAVAFFSKMSPEEFAVLPADQSGVLLLESCSTSLRLLQAKLGESDLRHFSATLIFAVITEDLLLLGHIGDGIALVLDESGSILTRSDPDRVVPEDNSTWFTISPAAAQHLRLQVLDRNEASPWLLALASDGPYEMLTERGDGDPVETIQELQAYIGSGDLRNDDDLADILNQMSEVADERMDDWSMVLWSPTEGADCLPVGSVCHSMLQEEEKKYGIEHS